MKRTNRVRTFCCCILGISALASGKFEQPAFSAVPAVTTISFQPPTVRLGGSFSATFGGNGLTSQTYFDVRVQMPDGTEQLVPNWQRGATATHSVPFETMPGIWKISGVSAHEDSNDHSQPLTPVSASLTVRSWIVTAVQVNPDTVGADGSFSANFSGSNLTADTYFDVRFRPPCSDQDLIAVNWQKGPSATHTVPAGTTPGPWTITGVWAHQDITDHSADLVSGAATLQVSVQNPLLASNQLTAVAVDPSRSATVYAATAGSGVYRSCDSGQTWIPASANIPDKFIVALALDPVTPGVVYAGARTGVLKSVSGGASWEMVSPTAGPVRAVAVDPRNPATIYAGTERNGIFKSVDSGRTWALDDFGIPAGAIIQSIAIDPVNSDIVYAGTDVPPPLTINRAQVFKTSDGGRHWEESWMSATSGVIVQTIQALIVDPKNSSTIYAGTLNPDRMGFSNQAGVFKSKDGGQTWLGLQGIWGPDHRSIRSLALDPINPANLYATSAYGEFWRSVNGGDIATSTYLNTHGSLMLAIDPASPATLYAGDGAGKNIFKSTDAGFTWRSLTIN